MRLTAFTGTVSDHFYGETNPNKADSPEVFGCPALAGFAASPSDKGEGHRQCCSLSVTQGQKTLQLVFTT